MLNTSFFNALLLWLFCSTNMDWSSQYEHDFFYYLNVVKKLHSSFPFYSNECLQKKGQFNLQCEQSIRGRIPPQEKGSARQKLKLDLTILVASFWNMFQRPSNNSHKRRLCICLRLVLTKISCFSDHKNYWCKKCNDIWRKTRPKWGQNFFYFQPK